MASTEVALSGQNAPERQVEQAAARVWYNRATRLGKWRVVLVALLPTCAGLGSVAWGLGWPSVSPEGQALLRSMSALSGIILWLTDELLWRPQIESTRRAAAVAQEMFDTALLGMPWNDLVSGHRHDTADVSRVGRPLLEDPAEAPKLANWYHPELQELPSYLSRLMAQRENLWWDRNLRKTYVWWVAAPTVIVVLVPIGMLLRGSSLAHFVLLIASLLPAVRAYILMVRDNWAAIKRLQEILSHASRLRDRYLVEPPTDDEALAEARRIQDALFRHRASAPVGLHYVYRRTRAANEIAYSDEIRAIKRKLPAASALPTGGTA